MKLTLSKQSGLSLVELMVAILLGTFLTAGLIKLFINSKQVYRVQESLSRLQENGRFAVNFLSRDLRMAGYLGCLDLSNVTLDLHTGSTYDNFDIDITGTDNSGINNSDTITIAAARASGIVVSSNQSALTDDLQVSSASGLSQNDVVLVGDCSKGDIFQITNTPTGTPAVLKHALTNPPAGSAGYPGNATTSFQKAYQQKVTKVYQFDVIKYALGTGTDGEPALYRTINGVSKALIPDIEDMQIRYGEDTDNDHIANRYVSASYSGLNFSNVVSIRIAIVAVTAEDNIATDKLSYTVFDGTPITPTDKRIRRVYTTTIAVRNKLL